MSYVFEEWSRYNSALFCKAIEVVTYLLSSLRIIVLAREEKVRIVFVFFL